MKPTNILIGRDGLVKIADFGLSRLKNIEDRYTPYIGTKGYMAPEIMLELGKYNEGFDMFAAGIILSEIYLREFLFKGETLTSIAKSMVRILGKINNRNLPGSQESEQYVHLFSKVRSGAPQFRKVLSNCFASEDGIDLAEKLLAINPAERPKANEALKYPYFVNSPQPDGNILPLLPRSWGIP
ncbi:unnamed protein product [Hymenolepis diminuta]|uniref:Protein kinase domain-containing protein n=1 Tax=Hymenolepis diminuta TaxID=6216 RepID=A0A3P7A1J7_HYMDI|nr:unnamed protein product [Hymenolepis diminuta]